MTHVAHPYGQRLGIIRDWRNRWFTKHKPTNREYIRTDIAVRALLRKEFKGKQVAGIEIDRNEKEYRVIVRAARPGLIVGRQGEGVATLVKKLDMLLRTLKLTTKPAIKLDIVEVRAPETQASLVAQNVAEMLEKRMQFRRVLKQTVEKVFAHPEVKGVRIMVSGRLGGAEMSRMEEVKRGRTPLQTLRADIDYALEQAHLPYGVIGVKVWIYRGDIFTNRRSTGGTARRAAAN